MDEQDERPLLLPRRRLRSTYLLGRECDPGLRGDAEASVGRRVIRFSILRFRVRALPENGFYRDSSFGPTYGRWQIRMASLTRGIIKLRIRDSERRVSIMLQPVDHREQGSIRLRSVVGARTRFGHDFVIRRGFRGRLRRACESQARNRSEFNMRMETLRRASVPGDAKFWKCKRILDAGKQLCRSVVQRYENQVRGNVVHWSQGRRVDFWFAGDDYRYIAGTELHVLGPAGVVKEKARGRHGEHGTGFGPPSAAPYEASSFFLD